MLRRLPVCTFVTTLACGVALRGAIDLVERSRDGRVRVTDHKTGKPRVRSGQVVAGGQALQPVLYALAAEKLFPDAPVESGRLYYCTAAGGFTEWADQKNISIVRREEGKESQIKFNFKDFTSGDNLGQNILLKPGDTIVVP